MSTGREVCVAGSRCWPLPSPGRSWAAAAAAARRRARLRGRALDELLADQRLRPDRAVASVRKSPNPGSSIRSTTAALLVGRDVERLDLADLDAGDLHVLARDHGEVALSKIARTLVVAAAVAARPWRAARPARDSADGSGGWRGARLMVRAAPGRVAVEERSCRERRRVVRRRAGWRRPGSALAGLRGRRAAGAAGSA